MTGRALLAAVSGIQANQTFLDEIGNNIANADTTGYKSWVVDFQDLLAEQRPFEIEEASAVRRVPEPERGPIDAVLRARFSGADPSRDST
jgi:flagellar basal body rod protein FlgG